LTAPGTAEEAEAGQPKSVAKDRPIASPHQDRRAGLVAFGVVAILVGAVCAVALAIATLWTLYGLISWREFGLVNARMALPVLVSCALASTFFIVTGIGSILARRWARALLLAGSWAWLALGAAGLAVCLIGPSRFLASFEMVPISFEPEGVVGVALVVVVALVGLLLPFIAFYRGRHVEATCQHRSPQPSWTDACPPAVLGLCGLLTFAAARHVVSAVQGVLLIFGHVLAGLSGVAVALGLALLTIVMARETYRLRVWAWWGLLILGALGTVSAVVSRAALDEQAFSAKLGTSQDWAIYFLVHSAPEDRFAQGAIAAAVGAGYLVYLLFVRRYFGVTARPSCPSGPEARPSAPEA